VEFNGVSADFTVQSDTQLRATVPASATTGKVTVVNTAGMGSSAADFTVDPTGGVAPRVTAVSPLVGLPGAVVTLAGSNLTGAAVRFGGAAATVTANSATVVVVTVPAGAVTAPITVTTPLGTTTTTSVFVVGAPPIVTGLSPNGGEPGTTLVTVSGSRFTGATQVAFAGTPCAMFHVATDGEIDAIVPAGAASGPVTVTTPAGSGTSLQSFTVLALPDLGTPPDLSIVPDLSMGLSTANDLATAPDLSSAPDLSMKKSAPSGGCDVVGGDWTAAPVMLLMALGLVLGLRRRRG
jgi:hypothetical protein